MTTPTPEEVEARREAVFLFDRARHVVDADADVVVEDIRATLASAFERGRRQGREEGAAEFQRMEDAWRGECQTIRREAHKIRRQDVKKLSKIQDLVGNAIGAYNDDRSPDRATKVRTPLEKAFNLCIEILGHYPQQPTTAIRALTKEGDK